VPGCATGEEAYTVGILLLEEAASRDLRPEIQVFGSDLDAGALAISREGRFPATIERMTEDEQPLQGMRILVADDEFVIAIAIEDVLREAGAEIVTATTLPEALKTANDEPLSAALLDVHLGRQRTGTVADMLAARAIPVVFYSGQALPDSIPEWHPDAMVLIKPARHDAFVESMLKVAKR
jgi:CheY-like chemotaxis protein